MALLQLKKRTLQGVYLVEISKIDIVEAPPLPPTINHPEGENIPKSITFVFTIMDAPNHDDIGQTLNYNTFYLRKNDGGKNQIGINQLLHFVGVVSANDIPDNEDIKFETNELLQEQVTVLMENKPYTDRNTGELKNSLKMTEYWPASDYASRANAPF